MNGHIWRILLVDDDPDDFILTRALLNESDGGKYALEWADSLSTAWSSLEAVHYDAVLVDYNLGSYNGVEFMREAAARGYLEPMILLTGQGSYNVDLQAMQAGAVDYLSKKEVTPPLLERAIRYAVERKQTEAALKQAREELEQRVQERTHELQQAKERLEEANERLEGSNRALRAEVQERQRVEEILRDSEARFRTVFEESDLGIAVKDLDGRIQASNPALQDLLGYTAEELRNKSYADITDPADVQSERNLFARLSSGEIDRYRLEKRYLRRDSGPVWARLAVSLVRDDDGLPRFAVFLVENIQDRKQMEAELAEVRRRLTDSREEERMELARDLHDGPMQELYGTAYQIGDLKDDVVDGFEVQAEWLEKLREVQEHLLNTIQELRLICSELRPPTLVPFGLEATLKSHAETFQQKYPEIDLQLDLQPDGKALAETLRLALFRVYQQSLANVVRHAGASMVTVRFTYDDEQAVLEIDDNGQGFVVPPRWIDLVRQGHLGLAGAAERVEAIGGGLEVKSTPGQGTRLRVIVPLNQVSML